MLVEGGVGLLHAEPVPLEDGDDEGGFGWKVMMDAGLADLDRLGDVGITECRESSLDQELVGDVHDPLCSVSVHMLI